MSPAVSLNMLARRIAPGLALLALAACSAGSFGPFGGSTAASSDAVGPSGAAAQGPTGLATQEACRGRANEMYDRRGRAEIYAPNSSVNTPYSANYQSGIPSHGLSGQFAYEQTVADCERNAGTGSGPAPTPVQPPPRAR